MAAKSDGTFNPNATANPVDCSTNITAKAMFHASFGNMQLDYKFHFLPDLHANLNLGYDVSQRSWHRLTTDSSRQGNNNYAYRGTSSMYKQNNNNYSLASFI